MKIEKLTHEINKYIKKNIKFKAEIGIISGSGIKIKNIKDKKYTLYKNIPHFPICNIKGHTSKFTFGKIKNKTVVCMEGRIHYYEKPNNTDIILPIYTLKKLGCKTLIITNTSGAINQNIKTGNIALIKDHINLQNKNPLIGVNEFFGTKFVNMENVYNANIRNKIYEICKLKKIKIKQAIYGSVIGPTFETPAEINAYRKLGIDIIGMSTIPEVIVAKYLKLNIIGISIVTNIAASNKNNIKHNHKYTLKIAENNSYKINRIIQLISNII